MSEYIRSPLIRSLYEKLEHQNKHANSKHEQWYTYRREYITQELSDKFILSEQDEETSEFLSNCFRKSDWLFTHFYHAIMKAILTWFMTSTSINGLLGRGSMFVFSSTQFRQLLNIPTDFKADSLLDLGAGDGNVTLKMAPYFRNVYVTEISPTMRWRLSQHGFTIVDANSWRLENNAPNSPEVSTHFDVISCLNLLDRCVAPLTLLKKISTALKPQTGILILALVLPIKQYVETTPNRRADEIINSNNSDEWESQLCDLCDNFLPTTNFELIRWTRLPYLCEGDFTQSFYRLNEVVLVLRNKETK